MVVGANPIRYLLSRPALSGRKARWLLQLSEFDIECVTPKAIKGQVFADLLASFPSKDPFELSEEIPGEIEQIARVFDGQWTLYFDGSSTAQEGGGAGIVSKSPKGRRVSIFIV